MSLTGNQTDTNVNKWRFGDLTTGPKMGGFNNTGYMIARRTGPFFIQPYGEAHLLSSVIKDAAAGHYY